MDSCLSPLPSTVRLRRAGRADAELLSKLGAETFTATFGSLYRPEDLAAFIAESHSAASYSRLLGDAAAAIWIAELNDGTPVGFAVARPCELPVPNMPPNSGELARLYVLPGAQGAGLGRRMLDEALLFLERNFDAVFLSVYKFNEGAQRLYARYGFEIIHEYDYMVGAHADPEYLMQRRMQAAHV